MASYGILHLAGSAPAISTPVVMKLATCLTVIGLSAFAQSPHLFPDPKGKYPPDLVMRLLDWPTTEVINSNRIPSANMPGVTADAERWVRMVVDRQWLPGQLEPLCIKGEFEKRDVVRYKWMKGAYSFMVAQTSSLLTLEIRPEAGGLGGESKDQRLDAVRKLCLQVFRRTGVRHDGQGGEIEIPDFNAKLIDFSFSAENTRESPDDGSMLIGKPKTMEEEQVKQPETIADAEAEARNWVKPGWEKSALAWEFWFRNLHWFADRKRVVIFFVKAEAGSVVGGPSLDERWFRR